MAVQTFVEGSTGRVLLTGAYDFSMQADLRAAVDTVNANQNIDQILLDFGGVDYVDSTGLGILLLIKEKASTAHKALTLVNCSNSVKATLDIACFGRIFEIQ